MRRAAASHVGAGPSSPAAPVERRPCYMDHTQRTLGNGSTITALDGRQWSAKLPARRITVPISHTTRGGGKRTTLLPCPANRSRRWQHSHAFGYSSLSLTQHELLCTSAPNLRELETQYDMHIKPLVIDNGGEYANKSLSSYFESTRNSAHSHAALGA